MTEILYNPTQFYLIFSFLLLAFFIIVAEWKEDFIYFLVTTIHALEMGIATIVISELNIIVSLVFFILSGYFMVLTIGYVPFLRTYTKYFREYFGLDD